MGWWIGDLAAERFAESKCFLLELQRCRIVQDTRIFVGFRLQAGSLRIGRKMAEELVPEPQEVEHKFGSFAEVEHTLNCLVVVRWTFILLQIKIRLSDRRFVRTLQSLMPRGLRSGRANCFA